MKKTNRVKNRYDRIAGLYDFIEYPMEKTISAWRTELLKKVQGKTLEVGIGTGKNIPYYPEEVELTGIDFSPKMIEKAKKRIKNLKRENNVNLELMDAENMRFKDNTFDTVVTSCVFCSVPDPIQGLSEIRRVSKNEGKIFMLEHVRSQKSIVGNLMDLVNPIPLHVYGANINRETYKNLKKAGFDPENIKVENLCSDIVKLFRIKNVN